jgi:SAM-dependent methyltransferase
MPRDLLDATVAHRVDLGSACDHRPAGGGDPERLAGVDGRDRVADGHLLAVAHELLDADSHVGERLIRLGLFPRRSVAERDGPVRRDDDHVFRDELVKAVEIATLQQAQVAPHDLAGVHPVEDTAARATVRTVPMTRRDTSWDETFSDRYEEWSAGMTADVPFYVELARRAEGPLVELAVGNGRVAIPVAQATGRRVIGIDTSAAMLEQARARAAEADVELDLREGDMRDLALDEPAALVYCPFRALLHLPTWADRRRTFERVAASLLPGGRFAWNAFVFDHAIAASYDGSRQDEPVPHSLRYAVGDNRIDITLDGGGTSSLWWATKNEWLGLVDVAGLEVESLHGGFAGEPFTDESREYVFVARRPVTVE